MLIFFNKFDYVYDFCLYVVYYIIDFGILGFDIMFFNV